jgi:hypothetical protein
MRKVSRSFSNFFVLLLCATTPSLSEITENSGSDVVVQKLFDEIALDFKEIRILRERFSTSDNDSEKYTAVAGFAVALRTRLESLQGNLKRLAVLTPRNPELPRLRTQYNLRLAESFNLEKSFYEWGSDPMLGLVPTLWRKDTSPWHDFMDHPTFFRSWYMNSTDFFEIVPSLFRSKALLQDSEMESLVVNSCLKEIVRATFNVALKEVVSNRAQRMIGRSKTYVDEWSLPSSRLVEIIESKNRLNWIQGRAFLAVFSNQGHLAEDSDRELLFEKALALQTERELLLLIDAFKVFVTKDPWDLNSPENVATVPASEILRSLK